MNIKLHKLKKFSDNRGALVAIEGGIDVPFKIKRVYYLVGSKSDQARGFHAHKSLKQIIICVHGSCWIKLDDGQSACELELCNPDEGILIEKLTWREIYNASEDCVLLVLADQHFDDNDYIRDYDEFREAARSKK
jgi:dTDP-4-dehydrorhamnose 3,5-epimerase-like enzyme